MGNWWYNIQHPEVYQGERRSKKYFEGWYYKVVHQSGEHAFALIPGVSVESQTERHAFIQLMDGTRGKSHYYQFPFESFSADRHALEIRIGQNLFSKNHIHIQLPDMQGELSISALTPLKSTWHNPGIMGWYSFTPFMQCYHGIVSMHHLLDGEIKHDGVAWNYDNGVGYIEKDWGTSFPKCWFWTHCNTFSASEKVSVFASVAHIPWMGNYFVGYIAAIQIGDTLHRFATYNGAKCKTAIEDDTLLLHFKKGGTELRIRTKKGIGADLKSPISGKMTGKVNESLQATMEVEFKNHGHKMQTYVGKNAGLEIAGETDVLLMDKW